MRNLRVKANFLKRVLRRKADGVIEFTRNYFRFRVGCICVALAGLFLSITGQAMAETGDTNAAVMDVKKAFQQLHRKFLTQTNDTEVAWKLARACYDMADLSSERSEKAQFATEGIAAAQQCVALESNSAAGHYYLGMDLGQLADTKRNLSALRMVREMEREFLTARALDEHFDYAGPDRNLGLLYWEAPVIGSIGSRSKARQHLQAAVQLAPDFPENHLDLIEAYLKWGDRDEALRELAQLERLWPDAQKNFTGERWVLSWVDWEKRLSAAEKKLEGAMKTTETPHSVK